MLFCISRVLLCTTRAVKSFFPLCTSFVCLYEEFICIVHESEYFATISAFCIVSPEILLSEIRSVLHDIILRVAVLRRFYANEKGVGEALAASGIPRDQLFLISKCWNDTIYAGGAAVRKQVLQSLSDLQTEYIDLYLVHWPVPGKHIDAYLELEKLHGEGKIKSIGLSNYSIEDYEELKPHMTIKPVSNQFEVNPFLFRKNTIDYFQKEGLIIQSYRTLRQGKEMSNPTLVAIAAKYNRPVSQILGRWAVQQNIAYFPKSENRGRMIENMAVTDFELSAEDIATMNNMTTPENIAAFKELYEKCCARDTPLQENREGVKTSITYD
eukprot:m.319188 g.319188  ORF g.319188 m.319188 type:complete len:326 (+) comp20299_c0_seq1:529-1506(+)